MFWVHVTAVVLLLGAITATHASPSPWSQGDGQHLVSPGTELNIDEAANRAQQRHGGQLISIRPAEQDGSDGWQATVLLENGRVKTLFVEARTGAVTDRRRN